MTELILTFVDFLIIALNVAIVGRVVMSWISPAGNDPISTFLYQLTEPIFAPIRRVIPTLGMFDLTPMVALILLNVIISRLLHIVLPS